MDSLFNSSIASSATNYTKSSSLDPSIERRKREYVSSGAPLVSKSTITSHPVSWSTDDQESTLSRLIEHMVRNKIDGPHQQRGIHFNGRHLGSGAQFSVYGHKHGALDSFPPFDQPFMGASANKRSSRHNQVIVAIKRPVFKLGWGKDAYAEEGQARRVGFGTPSQLYALELEILTLCDESIRNHRNIVKLLAWGIEHSLNHYENVEPLNIFLVLEHGNCSLRDFLAKDNYKLKGAIPWQVLRELALDITRGLSALHSSEVVHGDLKPDNILVFPDHVGPFFCIAKLSDFGLSVTDRREKVFNIGTPGWQAPELPSDEGITADMLVKCDYFSLGMAVFSTIFNFGAPPPRGPGPHGRFTFELAKRSLSRSRIPRTAIDRFSLVLEFLLQPKPSDRPSDLEKICYLLRHLEESVFDKSGFWINGRFDDNTPWGELRGLEGFTMMLGGASTQAGFALPAQYGPINEKYLISPGWQRIHRFLSQCPRHAYDRIVELYMDRIDEFTNNRSQEEHLKGEIVGEDLTGAQLLGLCFTDRIILQRRKRGSCAAIAAVKGYLPAQAVASAILDGTHSKLLKLVRINDRKWQWNAVSTGYLLAWKLASESPDEYESALRHFRSSGGYNMHYISPDSHGKVRAVYTSSGLLCDPLAWFSAHHPLHHAAILNDSIRIESLLVQDHLVDSNTGIGDTALHMACMAGAYKAVCCLIKHGADPTIKSKRFGTVPLHWLFVFENAHIQNTAALLAVNKSVLGQLSGANVEAFHYPFAWPVGTPLGWAVLANNTDAIQVLLDLGSTLESIQDFFPGRPDWLSMDYRPGQVSRKDGGKRSGPVLYRAYRKTWSGWVYSPMGKYRSPVVQSSCPSYQQQLKQLPASRAVASRAREQDISSSSGVNGGHLHAAVRENNPEAVKQLIAMGADVNEVLKRHGSPLINAIDERNPDIIQILLDYGARLDLPGDSWGDMPLLYAVKTGNIGIVKILLDGGADVDAESEGEASRRIALAEAVVKGHLEIAKLLLEHGANPLKQVDGHEVCLEAAVYANTAEFVHLFLKRGANPNTSGKSLHVGNSLMYAAHYANTKILLSLLAGGANPNIRQGPYLTALQAAINPEMHQMWRGQRKPVQILLEKGADVSVSGGEYGSVLQAAACTMDTALVRCLLDAGAPVSIGGGPHGSALQAAVVWNDDLDMIRLLLDRGASPNFTGDPGSEKQSALSLAVKKGDEEQVELLLRKGALPQLQEHAGKASSGGVSLNSAGTTEQSRMGQMLRDWGERDNTELDQWHSRIVHVSHPNLTDARSLLVQRFQMSRRYPPGVESLAEMVNKILDFAEYWPATLREKHERTPLSGKVAASPYLQVGIEPWPGMEMKVQRVVFRIKSHNNVPWWQPVVDPEKLDEGESPWLEVGVRSGGLGSHGAHQHPNTVPAMAMFCGRLTERTKCIIWDPSSTIPGVSDLIGNLIPGDVLDIYVKSKEDASHVIYVDSAQVIVYYDDKSTPIPELSMTVGENEIEGDDDTAPAQPSPPTTQDITEKPDPNSMQTETTENSHWKGQIKNEGKKGVLRRVGGLFTCCFK